MDSRRWDVSAALVFLLALLISAGRLSATGWTEDLGFAAVMAMLGASLGLALGVSRFRSGSVVALAIGYTIFLFPWALGVSQYPGLDWATRWSALAGRLQSAFATLSARQPLEDVFLFLTLVSLAYWLIGLLGGFFLTRRGSFAMAALPAGLALLIVHAFDQRYPRDGAYLFLYMLASLLLLARVNFLNQCVSWRKARVHLPIEATHDWNLAILFTVVITVSLAWILPAPAQAIGLARRAWQRLMPHWEDRETGFSRLVAGLQTGNRAAPYAGEMLTLGQDAASDADVVFTVHLPPIDHVPRYYWRARVYDFYKDGQWETRGVVQRQFSPAEAPPFLLDAHGTLSTYTFTLQMPSDWLFTPPRARWVSLPSRVGLTNPLPEGVEPLFFQATLKAGQGYQVQALDFSPTVAQLRAAGQDYPAWVGERYLQLPSDLPPRLRALAAELTANSPTPYDKAQAITNWLRASIRYNEHIPAPPTGQDVLEWFLFDIRQGFCTYSATAEVVLLRAAGVPARLAVGYAEGEVPPGTWRMRLVRQYHAHAWPEAYFPGLGWVEFEPTAAQSLLRRPTGEMENDAMTLTQTPSVSPPVVTPMKGESLAGPQQGILSPPARKAWSWVEVLSALGLVALLSGYLLWRQRGRAEIALWPLRLYERYLRRGQTPPLWLHSWARRARQTHVQRACVELYRAARRLGVAPSPGRTLLEVAALIRSYVPEASADIDALLAACLPAIYGPEPGDWDAARAAASSLRRKSRRAAWQRRLHMR